MFNRGPITDAGNEAVIAEILVEDSGGLFRVEVDQLIDMDNNNRESAFLDADYGQGGCVAE